MLGASCTYIDVNPRAPGSVSSEYIGLFKPLLPPLRLGDDGVERGVFFFVERFSAGERHVWAIRAPLPRDGPCMSETSVPVTTVTNAWVDEPGVVKPLLRLALPVLAEQFLAVLVGFSDTILTGHYLQEPQLAAMNIMAYLLWMLYASFSVVALGATAMVARYVGGGNWALARRVVHQALLVGAVIVVVAFTAGELFAESFVALLQLRGESAASAVRYLRYLLPVIPFVMINGVTIASLRGAGAMKRGLLIMSVVNVVNVVVSWALCPGLAGLPRLGWDGIAIGTACGYTVGGFVSLSMLRWGRTGLDLHWAGFRPSRQLIRRLLWVGVPGGLEMFSVLGCQLWFVSIVNSLGDAAAAAHGVAIRVESLAFLPGAAFQLAAATMAGQYLGARQHHKASRGVAAACMIGGGIMVTAGAIFYGFAPQLAALMLGAQHRHVAAVAAPLLRTIAMGIPALAVVMILTGALRGAGDTRWPLIFSLTGFLGIRIPLAYWLTSPSLSLGNGEWIIAGWALGVQGAWYAMVTDLWVRAALVFWRFRHGGWKNIEL